MKQTKTGRSGIPVSLIAMGCWGISGDDNWGAQDERDSIDAIHAALDSGITLFDNAEAYGDGYAETVMGKALKGRRSEAVVATKVSRQNVRADDLRRACEGSLKRLDTDYIDLYQIHYPNPEVPIAETMGALERLVESGKVREIGVCNFGTGSLEALAGNAAVVSNQLPYSLLWRAVEFAIRSLCVEREIGILCYSPLTQGLLAGKFSSPDEVPVGRARTRHFSRERPRTRHDEDGCERETFAAIGKIRAIADDLGMPMSAVSLAWLAAQEGVVSILAGARNREQVLQNARATERSVPHDALIALSDATEDLKQILGSNPDCYQSDSRIV